MKTLSVALCLVAMAGVVAPADEPVRVSGSVRDAAGAMIAEAQVSLLNAQHVVLELARTNPQGRFEFSSVPPGSYLLVVTARGFAERRIALRVGRKGLEGLEVSLELEAVHSEITVTAHPGRIEDAETVSQPVNVIAAQTIAQRAKIAAAQVAEEEVGVHLQRTSPTIAGIFVRGLTGNKVSVFVDGVRFSTAAQRGGINTFLNLLEPSNLDSVEILRGPNSAQYGSDAIGGSLQFITRSPLFAASGHTVHGSVSTYFGTADASYGSNLSTSYATRSFGLLVNLSGRRANTLRPGQGLDSHSAFTRFFGLRSDLFLDSRLPDTAFTQYGGLLKLNWSPAVGTQVIAHYARGQQDGGKRFDQMLGGDGNLIADLRNLMTDLFYVRYDRLRLGWLDDFTAAYSFNSQREERVNQGGNGNPLAAITHEYERTRAHGLQATASKRFSARHDLLFGAEYYAERIRAPSFRFDPVAQTVALSRPRVPDRARYRSGGAYVQDVLEPLPGRLRLVGNLRWSAASYRARTGDSPLVNGAALWPDDSLRASSVTFRAGAIFTAFTGFNLSANFSRGFRAPHMTDLGTLGLTGSGFEVAAADVAGLSATIGSTADFSAVSTGAAVSQLQPETSLSYEFGVHYRHPRVETDFAFFVNDIDQLIAKQALILPPGAVGRELGGQPIVQQLPSGVVFVPAATNPVLVRANLGNARILGAEHTLRWRVSSAWSFSTVFTYLRAREKAIGLPPNLEGGTPAPDGYLRVRYAPSRKKFWLEPYLHAADRQRRLSSLDIEDRRTGALRTRTSIRNFFLHGATSRALVSAGPDATVGTADDFLLATGETLSQIQGRVLGQGVNSAPLFTAVPGYATLGVRGGFRVGEKHEVVGDFFNLTDRNYRGISWGLDAPGRGLFLRYAYHF